VHVALAQEEGTRAWCVELAVPGLPVVLLTPEHADELGVEVLERSTDAREANDPQLRGDRLDEARDEIRRSAR
jgi:hypothetical protein